METRARTRRAKPSIIIGDTDHKNLVSLALAMEKSAPSLTESLLGELDRARVIAQRKVPANTVRMGSTLSFLTNGAGERRVTIVLPGEANIDAGRISVMTPIGTALIGLSEGQTISWEARDGRVQELSIVRVEPFEDAA